MRISDWSSDVCSSDLLAPLGADVLALLARQAGKEGIETVSVVRMPDVAQLRAADPAIGFEQFTFGRRGEQDVGAGASPCFGLRSAERRVGKECVRTCRSRWSPYP